LAVKFPRDAGFRPPASDNRLNAWYWRCSIKGATSAPLAGKRIAIKDNVCVAGIPTMNGSNVLEGYVPDVDATIVTRILDAGREIVGTGPIARTAGDAAQLIDVLAGTDGLDPRQPAGLRTEAYTKQLTGDKCLDHPQYALQNEKSPSSLGK
jgi:Asp-tRNA(Asn)/Glu-tRNA(Gln) amidotransferase A subunit family amidase